MQFFDSIVGESIRLALLSAIPHGTPFAFWRGRRWCALASSQRPLSVLGVIDERNPGIFRAACRHRVLRRRTVADHGLDTDELAPMGADDDSPDLC